jgi:hypothetical protein
MPLQIGHRQTFETLRRAFLNDDVALVECQLAKTGEQVAVVCAVNRQGGGFDLAPFALLFNDNPYDLLNPPNPEGGFCTHQ